MMKTHEIKEKIKQSGHRFSREFRKSTGTAIIAAFSFLVALSWKDVITLYIQKIQSLTPINSEIISALFITLISVIGILIVTKIAGADEKK